MNHREYNILVVDDEPDNRIILEHYLKEVGYLVDLAKDGDVAWEKLIGNPSGYDLVLLDWMMPGKSGLDVLKQMQKHPLIRHTQVIMQTARARSVEIRRGIDAGAWYYLTKPFDEETLLAIVRTALMDRNNYLAMKKAIRNVDSSALKGNRFVIRTLEEAQDLAALLSKLCPDPEKRGFGFQELLFNAIEHGNLGITYQKKSSLLAEGMWESEVAFRLNQANNSSKVVEVRVERTSQSLRFIIRDQGAGFDCRPYMTFDPERITHTHGRGIAMANGLSFDELEYRGCGNEVVVVVSTKKGNSD